MVRLYAGEEDLEDSLGMVELGLWGIMWKRWGII